MAQLKHRRVERRFIEVGCFESFEEKHHRVVILKIREAGWITGVRRNAQEGGFERIEQRERFCGPYPVIVAAEGEGVLAKILGEIVDQFKAPFPIEVGIAAVHANGKFVGHLYVRLGTGGREIVVAVGPLHAQLVDQAWRNQSRKVSDQGVVFIRVVLKARWKVEPIVQWRVILERAVVEKVANEQIVVVIESMVQPCHDIVIIGGAGDVEVFEREPNRGLELIDRRDIVQDDRIVIRRLAAALAFVVAEEERSVLDQGTAEGEAKLILPQLVELLAAAGRQVSRHRASRRIGRGQNTACVQFVVAKVFVG